MTSSMALQVPSHKVFVVVRVTYGFRGVSASVGPPGSGLNSIQTTHKRHDFSGVCGGGTNKNEILVWPVPLQIGGEDK